MTKQRQREYSHKHYIKNRGKIIAKQKKYASEHADQIKAYKREYQQKNKLDLRRKKHNYYLKNRARLLEYAHAPTTLARRREVRKTKHLALENEKMRLEIAQINAQITSIDKHQFSKLNQLNERVDKLQAPHTDKPRTWLEYGVG